MKNISGYSYKKFARTPFQACKFESQLFPGLRLRLTLGYMPAPRFRGATLRALNGYMPAPHFRGALGLLIPWVTSLLLCVCGTVEAEPWGKDADLVNRPYECIASTPCTTPLFGQFGETMIKFHQEVISPADGPRSNFRPSSSQYMLDAMRKYGFFKGFSMGCDRLMRENDDPWVYRKAPNENGEMMKWDPVP